MASAPAGAVTPGVTTVPAGSVMPAPAMLLMVLRCWLAEPVLRVVDAEPVLRAVDAEPVLLGSLAGGSLGNKLGLVGDSLAESAAANAAWPPGSGLRFRIWL